MRKNGKSIGWSIVKTIFYVLLVFFSISYVASILWIFINSFKTANGYVADSFGLPKEWDFGNYMQVLTNLEFKGYNLLQMFGNTMIIILWGFLMSLTFPHMVGYTMAHFEFKGRKLIEMAIYISMIIPVFGGAGTTLWFLNITGMYDSFLGIFFLSSGSLGFGALLLKNYYAGMSKNYAEAAYIDGASELQVFLKIYYPQAKPLMLVLLIQGFINNWNDYMTGYLYLPSHPTLALGLQQMQAKFVDFGGDYPVMFAGAILSLLPIFALYLRFSKEIMGNMMLGSMK